MAKTLLRTDREIAEIYQRHMRTVYRLCFSYMKNPADAEDAVSDTFFKMIQSGTAFESAEHEKAWLIRTAANVCKDSLRRWRHKEKPLDDFEHLPGEDNITIDGTLEAVMELPDKYKTAVYLYYYERLTGAEIAELLRKPQSTVRNHLHEARTILKQKLGGVFDEQ